MYRSQSRRPPQKLVLLGEPLVPEPIPVYEPFFFGEPFFGEPLFFAEPVVFEQPTPLVEEPPDSRTAVGADIGATAQAGNAFASS